MEFLKFFDNLGVGRISELNKMIELQQF